MVFLPIDLYSHPLAHRLQIYPRRLYNDDLFSSIIDSGFRELQQLERELGQLLPNEGDKSAFNFRCNVADFSPEELKLDIEGNELVLRGEHKQSNKNLSKHCTIERRIVIPDNINRETFKCDMDEKGRLHVTAQHKDAPIEKKHNIPIGFKQSKPSNENVAIQSDSKEAK